MSSAARKIFAVVREGDQEIGTRSSKGRQTRDGATVRRVQVMLDDATIERARVLGDGNLSQGIRQAVASLPTPTRQTERGMTAAQEKGE